MRQKFYQMALLCTIIFSASCTKEADVLAPVVSGTEVDTVLNIGDQLLLAPDITNLVEVGYTWLVNDKEVTSGETHYTFTATEPGTFIVVFRAGNKGGTGEKTFKILVEKPIAINLKDVGSLTVPICRVLDITPKIDGPERNDYQYEWAIGDSIIGNKEILEFIAIAPGEYTLTLTAKAGRQSETAECKVKVEEGEYINHAYTLLEYFPAPTKGFDWTAMTNYAPLPYNDLLDSITVKKKEYKTFPTVRIGSWGGYATFKFDHTVVNVAGKADIEIRANFSKSDIPTVYVAYDRNKNGVPDNDEWYEIKNSDYGMEDIPDYEITFTYKEPDLESDPLRFHTYFEWKDNQEEPQQGLVQNNTRWDARPTAAGTLPAKGFFPGYYMKDKDSKEIILVDGWKSSFSRRGKRITRDITGINTFSQLLDIDIAMAVNEKGEPVHLPGVDFVKVRKSVYTYERDFSNPNGGLMDSNMSEKRMTIVTYILNKHLN